ncbi:MAG: response regulator transcription factor [Candidatus Pacebacteria bacterium]|nr:response regulator transcription factor [Candidatus Paceibacterota bacterium]MCF7862701.1 response regulator transcription factor [Candidatus Paceibacterota bacterium]
MNVLIIEDNRDTLIFLKQALKENGFVTDTAEDGAIGLKKALSNDYDIIILDNTLPKISGKEICQEIRRHGKNTKIIMLSVNNEPDTKADILNIGADDYLSKPFSFNELSARLKALLRRTNENKTETLCVQDLILDTVNKTVQRKSEEIFLSPKEFALLEYLMRNKGKILSRIQILEHVWDMNADLFTNTVETHIANIRRKIKDKDKPPIIKTMVKAGYKIS